jgi:hypothetical protein
MSAAITSKKPVIINGTTYSETSAINRSAVSSKYTSYIGARVDGSNKVIFKGDIHAIRIYNRILTESEILHNQNIDILKYNIPS